MGAAAVPALAFPTDDSITIARKAETLRMTASLDKATYTPGEDMVLTVKDNGWGQRTIQVFDSQGLDWTQRGKGRGTTRFLATAPTTGGTLIVLMTRTVDNATESATDTYAAVA